MAWTQCGHADFQIRLDRNAILLLMMVQYFMGVMQILTAQTPPFCTTVTRTQCAEAADFNLDQLPPMVTSTNSIRDRLIHLGPRG